MPHDVNPSLVEFSLERGISPLGGISSGDNVQMPIEDESSTTFSPTSLSNDIPSSFWREVSVDTEAHLRKNRLQKEDTPFFVPWWVLCRDLNQLPG